MVKLVILLWRRPDMTQEQFNARWRGEHARLVNELKDKIRMRHYVQNHIAPDAGGSSFGPGRALAATGCDGVVEGWWDSLEDLHEGFNSPEGMAASSLLLEDERAFMDMSKTIVLPVQEQRIF